MGRAAARGLQSGGIWAVLKALRDTDVRHLLPRVSVPTLVLHRRNDRAVRIAAGRDMASKITGAQFVELDGNDHWFFAGAQQPVLEAIKRFVDALPRDRRPTRQLFPQRTRQCVSYRRSYFWALEKAVSSTSPIGCQLRPSN